MPIDPPTRRAPTWLLVTTALLLVPWSCAVNLWFAERELYRPLLHASGGLLHPALQACLPSVVGFLLLFRLGGLRLADVGWRARDLARGALVTLLLWLSLNACAFASLGGEFAWHTEPGKTPALMLGHLLGQLLGNALWEESVYRGFFLVQFVLLLRARGRGPKASAWLAALSSAIVFALPHIPNRIFKDAYDGGLDVLADQARLLLAGMFLAWVFLRTKNLWWAVGLHSLANYPTLAVAWGWEASTKEVVALLGLVMTVLWPWVFRGARACESLAPEGHD